MARARRMIWLGIGIAFVIATAAVITACRHSPVRAVNEDGATLFPSVSGENLHGQTVTFPDDLKGSPALVLVAFKRQQQAEVDTWLAQIDAFEAAIPGIRVVETPTISSTRWGWMAWFIDGGMRSGIPDDDARARTITLYTDVAKFREALGMETDGQIYAVLLDADARVRLVEPGTFTEGSPQRFAELLKPD
jgi:hypothetical protein